MKKTMILAFAVAILGMFWFSACNKLDNPVEPNDQELIFNANLPEPSEMNVPSDLKECTIEKEASLMFPKDDPLYPERPIKFIRPIGRILQQLNLTDEQKAQIRNFFAEYRDCVKTALAALRESEKAIIDEANQLRRQVMEKLKNGEITPEEARAAMRRINEATRERLINNPVRERVLQVLKNCYETLISNIKSVLTPEQLALFEQLMEKYKDRVGKGPGVRP